MEDSRKRKTDSSEGRSASKKRKSQGPKQWRTPKQGQAGPNISNTSMIEPGDSGIWITCDMHKEAKCAAEVQDLFHEYAARMYGTAAAEAREDDDAVRDIESTISQEIAELRQPEVQTMLFRPRKIDVKCVLFMKTQPPIEPTSFVHSICSDASTASERKRSRWIKRLTPMTLMGKATAKGLEEVAKAVLAPHFHQDSSAIRKFAIRTTIRNHSTLTRDMIIKQVADAVGSPHSVDLKKYDLLVLVEIYQNMCGMAVVGSDFDRLKRYNLAEIFLPSAKPAARVPEAEGDVKE